MKTLGLESSGLYPDQTISLLCKEACYITSPSDLSFYGIGRLNIRKRLFNVITDVVADAPPPNEDVKDNLFLFSVTFQPVIS